MVPWHTHIQSSKHMYSCSGSFQKNIRVQRKDPRFFFLFSSKKFLFLFREDCWKNEKKDHLRSTSSSHQRSRLKNNNTPSSPPLFSHFLDDDKYLFCWKQRTFLCGALSRRAKRSSFGGELDALGIYTECGGDLVWKHFVVTRGRSPFLFLFFLNKRNAFRRRFRRRETETCYNKRERERSERERLQPREEEEEEERKKDMRVIRISRFHNSPEHT